MIEPNLYFRKIDQNWSGKGQGKEENVQSGMRVLS